MHTRSNNMIIRTSKHSIDWSIVSDDVKTALIKVSGGLDSAIVLYMLCRYITTSNKDISIVVLTTNDWLKPYQITWSTKVLDWIKREFPTVKFIAHETAQLKHGEDYVAGQAKHLERVKFNYAKQGITFDIKFSGVNQAPPIDVFEVEEISGRLPPGPPEDRKSIRPTKVGTWFWPIQNFNKKDIAELYEQFDLTDTLFYQTRSCEETVLERTNNLTTHCGSCWWCQERKWGFGKL